MLRWSFRIVFYGAACVAILWLAVSLKSEQSCLWTNRCESHIKGLNALLEMYSSDQVERIEKDSGKVSERRAFYPPSLDVLLKAHPEAMTEEALHCPVYGVPYHYEVKNDGQSYLCYCPAHHRFHFDATEFVIACTPEDASLHLFIKDGKVYDLVAKHENPWDFRSPKFNTPDYHVQPTDIAPDEIEMLGSNPAPLTRF